MGVQIGNSPLFNASCQTQLGDVKHRVDQRAVMLSRHRVK